MVARIEIPEKTEFYELDAERYYSEKGMELPDTVKLLTKRGRRCVYRIDGEASKVVEGVGLQEKTFSRQDYLPDKNPNQYIPSGGAPVSPGSPTWQKRLKDGTLPENLRPENLFGGDSKKSGGDSFNIDPILEQFAPKRDYIAESHAYMDGILSGKIPACKFVQLACKRQLDDLERFHNHELYYFDEKAAIRTCRFVEIMPHVKGELANMNEDIVMSDFQTFITTTVFGWRRRDTNGGRRFKKAYVEVPRGNGKSCWSSALGLFCMTGDGEFGADIYSAATTKDQARIVHGDAQTMMRKRAAIRNALGVIVSRAIHSTTLMQPLTNSKFVPLSRESTNMDGLNPQAAFVDELHAHRTREIFDVLETAMGKRFSSLMWIITTAGDNTAGVCYEIRTYTLGVLEKTFDDDNHFGIVYTIDPDDDWKSPEVWKKANPNWGISVIPDAFSAIAQKAIKIPSAQGNFQRKHLNIWTNAGSAWMPLEVWDQGYDPDLTESDFGPEDCFLGLDLASRVDIACKAKLFVRDIEKDGTLERHYYGFLSSYLPRKRIQSGINDSYEGWESEGWLTAHYGDVIDFDAIETEVIADMGGFSVKEVAYDPWQSAQLAKHLSDQGAIMVETRATVQNFSPAMKEFEALIRSGRFHHDGNPVLRWMISNVVCELDRKDNVYPRKERPENKIDGVVAFIMALSRAVTHVEETRAYTPSRGFLVL